MELPEVLLAAGEALLIGFLLGAEREASRDEAERHPGVRDFILIALVGAVCGLLQNAWLTVAALAAITILLAVFHYETRERSGITTEMAAVATFCLGFLTATPNLAFGSTLAVALTVAIAMLLEAKRTLHRFIRETISETEFNDTLRFLAIIFIIYPVLPEGEYGPYGFFSPRQVWLFVILVSSISYAGYFLEKFLGPRAGLRLAGVMGGLASTTAATASFAHGCCDEQDKLSLYWQAAVIANAIQFPRVLAVLSVANRDLARASTAPLLAMSAAGLLFAWLVARPPENEPARASMALGNPFRLKPALKFGIVFIVVLFLSKSAAAVLGGGATLVVTALGGSFDVDAVTLSVSDLLGKGALPLETAQAGLMLALIVNAVVKTLMAAQAGARMFALRLAAAFAAMFGAGAVVWLVMRA